MSTTNTLLGRRGYGSALQVARTVGLETKTRAEMHVVYKAEKWSTHVWKTWPRIIRWVVLSISSPKAVPLYSEKAVCSLPPHTLPHQPFLTRVCGLTSVLAGRKLTCLLSSLNLVSLVFFLHPKCLVEIQNPFMRGRITFEVVVSHLYLGVNVF